MNSAIVQTIVHMQMYLVDGEYKTDEKKQMYELHTHKYMKLKSVKWYSGGWKTKSPLL